MACLWQANPDFNNMEIIEAVIKSCDQYDNANTFTGYGIPNFAKADAYLKKINQETKANSEKEKIDTIENEEPEKEKDETIENDEPEKEKTNQK